LYWGSKLKHHKNKCKVILIIILIRVGALVLLFHKNQVRVREKVVSKGRYEGPI
jgi:hypothetical protein